MSKEDILRVPALYLLTALGAGVGFYMTYIHGPLDDRVTVLESRINTSEKEIATLKSDIKYLGAKR